MAKYTADDYEREAQRQARFGNALYVGLLRQSASDRRALKALVERLRKVDATYVADELAELLGEK